MSDASDSPVSYEAHDSRIQLRENEAFANLEFATVMQDAKAGSVSQLSKNLNGRAEGVAFDIPPLFGADSLPAVALSEGGLLNRGVNDATQRQIRSGDVSGSLTELPVSELVMSARGTQERQAFWDAVTSSLVSADERSVFTGNMVAFEQRAKTTGLSTSEVERTYEGLRQLVSAEAGRRALPFSQRVLLATNCIFHAARPEATNQGPYATCGPTALEEKLFTQCPSVPVGILREVAFTGSYTAPDGRALILHPDSFVPQIGADRHNPVDDGSRSYATQILNNVFINDVLQRYNPPQYYRQTSPEHAAADNGERVISAHGSVVTMVAENGRTLPLNGALRAAEITGLVRRYTGETNSYLYIGQRDGFGESIRNPRDLSATLLEAQRENRLPFLISVFVDDPNFGSSSGKNPLGHIISVRGYDGARAQVQISNEWGARRDTSMSIDELFNACIVGRKDFRQYRF